MRLTQMGAKIALGFKLTDEERANLPGRVHVGCAPTRTKTFIYGLSIGPFILPPAAYRELMNLEPTGHVFHELEAVHDGVSLGPHFLQLEAPIIDCVDVDRTTFSRGGRAYIEEVLASPPGPDGQPLRLSLDFAQRVSLIGSAIAGRHWWRAPSSYSWQQLCSARLVQSWRSAGVAGVRLEQCYTSDRTH
ncbi:imm11 family protein [Vitreimonas flagellata]|uniref:imm11 family protein n=1 Tax=Vitreimonas flagellata TaxID=2560861 RepID=UPI001075782E|nr:hypothetical protein [Vitreimonas flagellata]